MSKTKEIFEPALDSKKIPILVLDNKWHQLKQVANSDREFQKLEKEMNELLKKQGKANTEIKKIRNLKRQLLHEIIEQADDAVENGNKNAEKKMEESKRLVNECNEKISGYEDDLQELPARIEKINKELMLKTMEACYDILHKNKAEIDEIDKWVSEIREKLKAQLIKKQEEEEMNQKIYAYMHDIFGRDVIDIFDLKYLNGNKKK